MFINVNCFSNHADLRDAESPEGASLSASVIPVFAQVNTFRALEERYSLDLDHESFPELKFNWNVDGRVQGDVKAQVSAQQVILVIG